MIQSPSFLLVLLQVPSSVLSPIDLLLVLILNDYEKARERKNRKNRNPEQEEKKKEKPQNTSKQTPISLTPLFLYKPAQGVWSFIEQMKASDEGHISALMLARALSCAALRYSLSERDESGGRRRPDTWSTVSSRLVGNGEFPKVVSDHLRLDLNLVERVSVVDTDDGTNHLWNDDHVSEVRSHGLWLLSLWGFLLGLVELLNQSVSLALQTTLEPIQANVKRREKKESQ